MNNTLTKTEGSVATRGGRIARARAAVAGKLVALAFVVGIGTMGGVAGATDPADPTGGAADTLQTTLTGWLTTYGIPMIVAVFALGLIIRALLKSGKRASSSI